MAMWRPNRMRAMVAAALGAMSVAAAAQDRGAAPAQPDNEYVFGTVGAPVRSAVTGNCVRTGFQRPGVSGQECGAPVAAKSPAPVAAKAPPKEPLPEFVREPEPQDMVPVPPMTAAVADDGIGEHSLYYDEEPLAERDDGLGERILYYDEVTLPEPGDGILARWDNPDFAAELAAAEAQMARADLPPPAPLAPAPKAPVPVAQPAPPPATPALRLTLDGETHFGFNKYQLTPSGRDQVDKLFGELAAADYDVILITGHTDRIGTKAYNRKLSERRALDVKEYLASKGIEGKRLQAKWVGAAEPVTPPGTCAGLDRPKTIKCLAPDRRVEVQVVNARPR